MWTRRKALAGIAAATVSGAWAQIAPTRLRRGVALHHLLNWPEVVEAAGKMKYLRPAFESASYCISDLELAALRGAGVDFVRLTVDPSIFIESNAAERVDLERHVAALLGRLRGADLAVIVDLHPVKVNPAYAPLQLIADEHSAVFAAYVNLVSRMAAFLDTFGHDGVIFELMNEPLIFGVTRAEVAVWQRMLERLHGRARESAPTLPLVLTGAQSSYSKALFLLDLAPFKGSNVYYTFHFYEPLVFTHQGVQGIVEGFVSGLAWPEDDANVEVAVRRAVDAVDAAQWLSQAEKAKAREEVRAKVEGVMTRRYKAATVDSAFAEVGRWADAQAVARDRVLVGEFGCVLSAADRPTGQNRLAWLHTVAKAAEREGFPWAYWAYKGNGGMELVEPGTTRLDALTVEALGLRST